MLMPKYFLHVRYGDSVIWDRAGTEFLDAAAARQEALLIYDLVQSRIAVGASSDARSIEVVDESGNTVSHVSAVSLDWIEPQQSGRDPN